MAYEKSEQFPCFLCESVAGRIPHALLFETELAVAVMSPHQRSEGAVLVMPKRHALNCTQLTKEETVAVMSLLCKSARAVCKTYKPDGLHTFCNAGKKAGQSVPHMHFQIQTRYYDRSYAFGSSSNFPIIPIEKLLANAKKIRQAEQENHNFNFLFSIKKECLCDPIPKAIGHFRKEGTLIKETSNFFAVVPEQNRIRGALVILPKRNVSNYLELNDNESTELILLISDLSQAIENFYDPIGLSLWSEIGIVADQIYKHLLVELVPYHADVKDKDYKYQNRTMLTITPIEERIKTTQAIKTFLKDKLFAK